MTQVHPTAIISTQAEIGENVTIGAYARIVGPVRIESSCVIGSHVFLQGPLVLGKHNIVNSYSILGESAQHLKDFKMEQPLEIGDSNFFGNFVTVHQGIEGHPQTKLGSQCLFSAFVHIAHNCFIGNQVQVGFKSALAGHVVLEDGVVLGQNSVISQYCKIGKRAVLADHSGLDCDFPPYAQGYGRRALIGGPVTSLASVELKTIYEFFLKNSLSSRKAFDQVAALGFCSPEAVYTMNFIKNSKKGILWHEK